MTHSLSVCKQVEHGDSLVEFGEDTRLWASVYLTDTIYSTCILFFGGTVCINFLTKLLTCRQRLPYWIVHMLSASSYMPLQHGLVPVRVPIEGDWMRFCVGAENYVTMMTASQR